MKIYELKNDLNELFAFEMSNTLLSRNKTVKIIGLLPNAKINIRPKLFSLSNQDKFCEFEFMDDIFIIEEPWGDNSRYWLGPKSLKYNPNLIKIAEHFKNIN